MDSLRSVFSRVTYTQVVEFVPEKYHDEEINAQSISPSNISTIKDIPDDIIILILNTHLEGGIYLIEKIIGDAVLHGCLDVLEYIKSVRGFDNLTHIDYYWEAVRVIQVYSCSQKIMQQHTRRHYFKTPKI